MDSILNDGSAARVPGLLASLDLIAKASAQLLQPSSKVENLLPAVLEMAKALIAADAYAVWEIGTGGVWNIVASAGLSEAYIANNIPPPHSAPPLNTSLIANALDCDFVTHRRSFYVSEGIKALMVVPLTIAEKHSGTLVFYYRTEHAFTEEEAALGTAMGNITGAALSTASLYRQKELDRKRSEFLSQASAVLSSSLDYETTLAAVTRLAVPQVADWCAIDILENGTLNRLAIAHTDPAKIAIAEEYRKKYPPDLSAETGVAQVIRTGETLFVPAISEEMLNSMSSDRERLRIVRSLGICSIVFVPLIARGRTVGVLSLITSDRKMDAGDVTLAEDLAKRSAIAIDNAELYRALEKSERKFRAVSDTVACGIYIHDGTRLLYVNEAAIQMSGYTRQELQLMSMFDLVHPEDRAMVQALAMGRMAGQPEPNRYEFRGVRKDGSVVWLDFSGAMIDYGGARALLATAFDITERRQVEERIQQSELEARTLLQNMPDVVARYGPDLRYRYISPAVERMTGIPAEQFIGRTHAEMGFPADLCELFDNSIRKIFATGRPDSIEFSVERNGETVQALGYGIPQFGADGSLESVLTISRDVTEYRRATDAVRRNEKELRLLTDSLPALVAYVDKEEHLVRVNRTFEEWFGHPKAYFYGRKLRDVLGDANYARIRPYVQRVLNGESVQYAARNRYADKERHVLIAYVPDFDDQHQVRGFAALVQDLTERRETEQALETSEQRLEKFAEAGPAIFYSNLANGYCDFVSQRYLDYTGHVQELIHGYEWLNLVHPEDKPRVQANWQNFSLTGERNEDEFRLRRHDGSYRWFHTWNVPVRDDSGKVVRWFGTMMDVEEQKQAEEALRKSEKLAAVGRLAASISHEINNPLESVTNLVFLAKNDPETSEQSRAFLATAEKELARISQIATQTLRFYRQSSRPTRTNIGELIDSVIGVYEGRLANSQVQVEKKYRRQEEPLQAFEGELRQVIANLFANAIDASAPGGRIVVRACHCRRWSTGERGTRITIADTGHGIGPDLKKRIFEPFFTTKKATGTGLGLWVTREIVDKHHGYIRVKSSPGKGTVFVLFVPDLTAEAHVSAS